MEHQKFIHVIVYRRVLVRHSISTMPTRYQYLHGGCFVEVTKEVTISKKILPLKKL